MDRDPLRLRRAPGLVEADLCRTTGAPWRCEISADLVLTVTDGQQSESVLLEREIQDEEWYVDERAFPEELDAALDDEAAEAVADEVLEVLRALDVPWPLCIAHGALMGSCSGVWFCEGPPGHDVAEVGALGR